VVEVVVLHLVVVELKPEQMVVGVQKLNHVILKLVVLL
jgi:hypothetical protein